MKRFSFDLLLFDKKLLYHFWKILNDVIGKIDGRCLHDFAQ